MKNFKHPLNRFFGWNIKQISTEEFFAKNSQSIERQRLTLKAEKDNKAKEDQRIKNATTFKGKRHQRANPSNTNNFGTKGSNSQTIDLATAKRKSTFQMVGIRRTTDKVSSYMLDSDFDPLVVHKVKYLDPSITEGLFKAVSVTNRESYYDYISRIFFQTVRLRCERLNLRRNNYIGILNKIQEKNVFYYILNFLYLSSNVSSYNLFKSTNNISIIEIPKVFIDIISHMKTGVFTINSKLGENQVRHQVNNTDVRQLIENIKSHIDYPQIEDYTDDFYDFYTSFISFLERLEVDLHELSNSMSATRYIHVGLYSHRNTLGSDYFINLDEFMYNVLFGKVVSVENGPDSNIYRPEITTLTKEDSEHHLRYQSLNDNFVKFFNDQLGLLPFPRLDTFPGDSELDYVNMIEDSQILERDLRKPEDEDSNEANPTQDDSTSTDS